MAIGGENILNTYPDVNEYGAFTVGNSYGQFSPFGFNGANFYVRGQLWLGHEPPVAGKVVSGSGCAPT